MLFFEINAEAKCCSSVKHVSAMKSSLISLTNLSVASFFVFCTDLDLQIQSIINQDFEVRCDCDID